jgi:SAM-dependent methyltransferase
VILQGELREYLLSRFAGDHYVTGIHLERFLKTFAQAQPYLRPGSRLCELGPLSALSHFLADRMAMRPVTIQSDLRFPWDEPADEYDAVLSLEVLEHLNDAHTPGSSIEEIAMFTHSGARNMFSECFRILRPGGMLLLTTPNVNSIDSIGNMLRRRHPFGYPPHVREYTMEEVISLAREAGFVVERACTFFAWNSHPDIKRGVLRAVFRLMGFDMSNRGDDAFFAFRKPARASRPPASPPAAM